MKFELSDIELKKFYEWASKHEEVYEGAIGGRYTFSFTRTSVGDNVVVTNLSTKETVDITDYDSW